MFPAREEYDALAAARIEEATAQWQREYNQRADIEGTFSQAVRGYGLRRTRDRGEQKTHLHNLATAQRQSTSLKAWRGWKKRSASKPESQGSQD